MSQTLPEISREQLSRTLREARERKGWTLEQLARELWARRFNVSQNKLWRLENKPPRRVDTELLLWLEKVLNVELLDGHDQTQVLIEDVIAIRDLGCEAAIAGSALLAGRFTLAEARVRLVGPG